MTSSSSEPGRTAGHPGLELKADRPRQIDRYIDYFGDGTASSAAAAARGLIGPPLRRADEVID